MKERDKGLGGMGVSRVGLRAKMVQNKIKRAIDDSGLKSLQIMV